MKSFVVLCVALVAGIHAASVTLPPTQEEKFYKARSECITETGVSSKVVIEAGKGNFIDHEGLNKFAFCFFNKTGMIDGEGKLNLDKAIAQLPPGVDKDEVRKLMENCKSKSGRSKEDLISLIKSSSAAAG